MNNKRLKSKYSSILFALKIFKAYTAIIIMIAIWFLLSGLPNVGLFLVIVCMNCGMNYLIYSKISKYFEILNDLLIKA